MTKTLKQIFTLLMVLCLSLTFLGCEETIYSSTGITKLTIEDLSNEQFYTGATSSEFKVEIEGNEDFTEDDLKVVVNDTSVVNITFEKEESWLSSNYISFSITGLNAGTTSFHFETIDKVIKTEPIQIEILENFKSITFDNTENIVFDEWSYGYEEICFSYELNKTIDDPEKELEFISENTKIATIKYDEDSWLSDKCVIKQKNPGKTFVYIQTKDGTVKSEKIKVIVKEEEKETEAKPIIEKNTQATTIAPNTETVYITNTGSKYHRAGCRFLSKSKIEIDLSKAKSQGYTPCGTCY